MKVPVYPFTSYRLIDLFTAKNSKRCKNLLIQLLNRYLDLWFPNSPSKLLNYRFVSLPLCTLRLKYIYYSPSLQTHFDTAVFNIKRSEVVFSWLLWEIIMKKNKQSPTENVGQWCSDPTTTRNLQWGWCLSEMEPSSQFDWYFSPARVTERRNRLHGVFRAI